MPFEIKFKLPPAGYFMASMGPGQYGWICVREFVSSEDGDLLISRLSGFPSQVLDLVAKQGHMILPSTVDHMVVIIRKDGSATAYINEASFCALARPKRDLEPGECVRQSDLADVQRLRVPGVTIPPDAGLFVLFSVGWRRALYYDLGPIAPGGSPREEDIELLLGQYYCYLLRQDLFKITDAEWGVLLAQRWFPFISLSSEAIEGLISHIRSGRAPDDLLDKIAGEVRALLPVKVVAWATSPFFAPRREVLERAVERYLAGDFISAIHNLYPQIEGVLRNCHRSQQDGTKPTQANLIRSGMAYGNDMRHQRSLLLPERFQVFLKGVVFADFDPSDVDNVSRHSLCHGVAPPDKLTLKEATLAVLVLDQLYYFLTGRQGEQRAEGGVQADG